MVNQAPFRKITTKGWKRKNSPPVVRLTCDHIVYKPTQTWVRKIRCLGCRKD